MSTPGWILVTAPVIPEDRLVSLPHYLYLYTINLLTAALLIKIIRIIKNTFILREGTTFDPVLSVKEVGHVKHMHAVSLLIHPNFSPNFMVTCLDLFENSLLIHFQTDRKFTSDPVRTN